MPDQRHGVGFVENDRAETGIGTLIVFIAMILVAAVAAGVLIRTASNLQEQAENTGDTATNRVASAVETIGVFGERHGATTYSTDIRNVTLHAQLASGSPPLDLNMLRLRWSDGKSNPREMNYTSDAISNTTFKVLALRDADTSFTAANPVVNQNDLFKITIASVYLDPRTKVNLYLSPEGGAQVPIVFTTPTTYSTSKYITLV